MSNAPARSALRERVSAAILDAAATALAERSDASMRDVAVAAGIARATLYRYFQTREELIEALARQAVEEAGEGLDAARLDQVDVETAFGRAVRALVAVGDAFVVLVRSRGSEEPAGFDRRIAAPLKALVERGQREGELRADVPATWLFESLLAFIVSVLPSAPSLGAEDAVQTITGLFLDGARGTRVAP